MDLEKVKAFITLVEAGNFTKAADALYVSQPALSKQILSLEDELQVPLFYRTKKSTYLTTYGEFFLPYAKKMLMNYTDAREQIRQVESLQQGTLRFGVTHFIGTYLMPPIIAAFRNQYPGIHIDMVIHSSRNLRSMLDKYQLEFLLVSDYVEMDVSRYTRTVWQEDTLCVAVSTKHPLASKEVLTIRDLNEHVLIMKKRNSSLYKYLQQTLGEQGLSLKTPLFMSQQEAIKNSVLHNLGISILPEKAIALEKEMGYIKGLQIENYPMSRNIEIIQDLHRAQMPSVKAFLEVMQKQGECGRSIL